MERQQRPHTVSGLSAKRKELRAEIKRLIVAIRAIDVVTGLFSAPPKPKRARAGKRQKFIIDYIRKHGCATSGEITKAWLAHRPDLNPGSRRQLGSKMRGILSDYEQRGYVVLSAMRDGAKVWTLSD